MITQGRLLVAREANSRKKINNVEPLELVDQSLAVGTRIVAKGCEGPPDEELSKDSDRWEPILQQVWLMFVSDWSKFD